MTNTTSTERNDVKTDKDRTVKHDESRDGSRRNDEENNIEHVKETGLPPGIEPDDLFDPNGDRPRGVPNGDNS